MLSIDTTSADEPREAHVIAIRMLDSRRYGVAMNDYLADAERLAELVLELVKELDYA